MVVTYKALVGSLGVLKGDLYIVWITLRWYTIVCVVLQINSNSLLSGIVTIGGVSDRNEYRCTLMDCVVCYIHYV